MNMLSIYSKAKRRTAAAFSFLLASGLAGANCAPAQAHMDDFMRLQAVNAAYKFLDTSYTFPDDCTFFVSQALWDGGLASTADWTPRTSDNSKLASHLAIYNPGPSKDSAAADLFTKYMRDSGAAVVKPITWSDNTAAGAELGDVIAYDWNGNADGVMDHVAIVTSFTSDHHPNVSQHTPTQRDRYWSWNPDSNPPNWIEFTNPGSRAFLIHFV